MNEIFCLFFMQISQVIFALSILSLAFWAKNPNIIMRIRLFDRSQINEAADSQKTIGALFFHFRFKNGSRHLSARNNTKAYDF